MSLTLKSDQPTQSRTVLRRTQKVGAKLQTIFEPPKYYVIFFNKLRNLCKSVQIMRKRCGHVGKND